MKPAANAPMQGDTSPSDETSAVRDTPKPVAASSDAAAKRQKVTVREEPAWSSDGRLGEAELKTLCRLFSIRVIVIPTDPNWKVCFYGKTKYKDVVAICLTEKHFDFVKPESKSAKDISGVVIDPNGGFLVRNVCA